MTINDLLGSADDEEVNTLKIQLLDYYVARNGPDYCFFHDLASGRVYDFDRKVAILNSLDGVVGNYNITSGYLTREAAQAAMGRIEDD